MAYTTERLEKDALKLYVSRYGNYETAIAHFCRDWKTLYPKSGKPDEFAAVVNASLQVCRDENPDASEEQLVKTYCRSWEAFDKAFGGALRK